MDQDLPFRSYHFQENNQYPSNQDFDDIVQTYLDKLSFKKRDKALIDRQRYELILQVLQEPKNTSVSTAQFRFWVKKMFQLVPLHSGRLVVCHDNKPVAMREQIYHILIWAHRQSHHGGRDKTSALVRRRFSWIPKELIARFVRHCPFCITRRNGHADMFSSYATIQHNHHHHHQQTNSVYPLGELSFIVENDSRSSDGVYHSPLSSPPADPAPCCHQTMLPAPNGASGIVPLLSSAESVLSDDTLCPLPSSSSSSSNSAALTTSSSSTSTSGTANSPTSTSFLYMDHHRQRCYPPSHPPSQPSPEEMFIKDTTSLASHFTLPTTSLYTHRQQQPAGMDGYEFTHMNTVDPTSTSSRQQEQQSMLASPTSPLSPGDFGFGPKQTQSSQSFANQPAMNLMPFY